MLQDVQNVGHVACDLAQRASHESLLKPVIQIEWAEPFQQLPFKQQHQYIQQND